MNTYKLEQLINRYEGPKLDFKEKLSLETNGDKKELTKDIIAIANSSGGRGYIIFGVEDKTKRLVGIDPTQISEEQIQQVIARRIDPPISIGWDIVEYKGKNLGVLSIFTSFQKPHQMLQNGAFYIRRGSTTDLATREEIASMLQLNGLFSYESTIIKNAAMSDLDDNTMASYLSKLGIDGNNPNKIIMESLGFIGIDERNNNYRPTVGGMLILGKDLSRFLPHAFIKVVNGDTSKFFRGNILTQLTETENYLKTILGESYPYEALLQALDNAIVHRDYTDVTRGILIEISDTNVVISNPGALLPGNFIYLMEKDKNPRKRNIWLHQRLMIIGDESRFSKEGMGMPTIKNLVKNAKFVNVGMQNLFKVILPR